MDALRKAEEAKRQSTENNEVDASGGGLSQLSLEPLPATKAVPAATQPTSPLPILSQHLDSLNADLAATSAATPASNKRPPATQTTASSNEEKERNAARNVFAAKQSRQTRWQRWLVFGLAGLAVLGIGVYFWWQMQSVTRTAVIRPVHQQAPTTPMPASPLPPAEPQSATANTPVSEPVQAKIPTTPAERIHSPINAELPARAVTGTANPENPFRRSTRQPVQDQVLDSAYEALLADRLNDARRDYEQVLRRDHRNVDALLGLATIAARQGQSANAAEYYRRALESDPKDLNALAGLINLNGQTDPGLSESRLKTQLASQPDSAALNFALGNLHAAQNRWNDAQQAYFRAYAAEPGNADYLYNLAVSLDHLRQNELATRYYQSALNAAGTRNTVFDKEQVKSRLLDLQP